MSPAEHDRLKELAAVPLAIPAGGSTGKLASGKMLLCGWSIRETSGANPAAFEFYDGDDARGALLASVGITVGGSPAGGPGSDGLAVEAGLFFLNVAGAMTGCAWVKLLDE